MQDAVQQNKRQAPTIPDNAPFAPEQRAWVNGFLAGLFYDKSRGEKLPQASTEKESSLPLLILFGSQTGSAEALAKRIGAEAAGHNFAARVLDMNAHAHVDWKTEERILIVTSTWGDGDPPDNAAAFWNFLNSTSAPKLDHLKFSVLALGDKNYSDFCGAGKKFDARLEQLGARRIHPRADCDVDYESTAKEWIESIWKKFSETGSGASVVEISKAPDSNRKSVEGPVRFSRQNPFPAWLLTNRRLNDPRSSKDTRHFEIALEGSDLNYEPGDALGVIPKNSPALVEDILSALDFTGEEAVKNGGPGEIPLRAALLEHFEIRQISRGFFEAIAERSGESVLRKLLNAENKSALEAFLHGRETIDLLMTHPRAKFSATEFVALLRKLNPRLYSISSSPNAHRGEVHLTVAAVRYESHGRARQGVCSTFLADRVETQTPVRVFVQPSHGFRLPEDATTPIIMVGPGTGVAPFRAFLEERRAVGAKGKSWLFFGDQRSESDFLYRQEIEAMVAEKSLTHLHTAFSRDQAEKVYVQHRMLENAKPLWNWLESGAHFYVCGDAKRMAKDVDATLHQIIQTAGGRGKEQALEYVQKMKTEKRYQRDVY